ncbi:MAG: xanthine dehydrogenase family protein molybdopterin-binding subunit [Ilumatobacteraceae bacterium]
MGSILGNRVQRVEDPRMLTTGGTYVEDVPIDAAWVHFVRSEYAHGRIVSYDIDDARKLPGVLGVFTGEDLDLPPFPHVQPILKPGSERPLIAKGTVRFVGEPVVAVVAVDRHTAVDAGAMVYVAIEPLTAVVDLDDALGDTTLVHPSLGTNTYATFTSDHQADFDGCEVVLDLRVENQRINGSPIEPRSGLAYWEPDPEGDRLVHYSACQGAHPTRDILAKLYDLPPSRVRAVVPDVGGGFGVKSRTIGEELTLGWLSKQVGRPVRYTETRTESMQALPQGRGQRVDVRIGGTRDGRITAYQIDVLQDGGAYPLMGAYLPMMTQRMTPGVYDIPNCGFRGVSVATNKISVTAYRGAGRPEAALAIERAVDYYAAEIGLDPAEVRRRNFIPKFMQPYTTGIGTVYDVGDYGEAMRRVLEAADYPALRAAQAEQRSKGSTVLTGIGIAVYVEITSAAAPTEYGAVHLLADGRMRVLTGATPYGQGHVTTWKMIIADRLGVRMDDVDVVHGDTDEVPTGGLTVGSRSVQVAGSSLVIAAGKLADAALDRAANLLEAAVEDVVLDSESGTFHVAGSSTPAVGWADIARSDGGLLVGVSDFKATQPTYPFGAHVAVVDVDTETGKVTVQRVIAVDDAGTLLNPLIVDGQIHGGIGQGVAQALLEWMQYDEDGNPVTSNFAEYPVISAAELPSYELVHMETPTWVNPLGAKGAGESGTIGSITAVLNAVVDALAPLGVRHIDGPATPQRVWNAIALARR